MSECNIIAILIRSLFFNSSFILCHLYGFVFKKGCKKVDCIFMILVLAVRDLNFKLLGELNTVLWSFSRKIMAVVFNIIFVRVLGW